MLKSTHIDSLSSGRPSRVPEDELVYVTSHHSGLPKVSKYRRLDRRCGPQVNAVLGI